MFNFRLWCLGCLMLITGAFTTILLKYQDLTIVGRNEDGKPIYFFHPAIQASFMFFGEMLCIVPFWMANRRQQAPDVRYDLQSIAEHEENIHQQRLTRIAKVLLFSVPAICDVISTICLNIGLYFTFTSTYQILRGTLIIFTALFTRLVLRKVLYFHHWIGLVMLVVGAAIVGISSVIFAEDIYPTPTTHQQYPQQDYNGHNLHFRAFQDTLANYSLTSDSLTESVSNRTAKAPQPLLGDLLIIGAQGLSAMQFIIEEKFLQKFQVVPLQAVGLEGFWGLLLCLLAIPVLSLVQAAPYDAPIDEIWQAFRHIQEHQQLQIALVSLSICVALFNFFGLWISKELSGLSRASIDALRTVLVWGFSFGIGWEQLQILQMVGFLVMVAGSAVYNEVVKGCLPDKAPVLQRRSSEAAFRDPLLSSSSSNVNMKPSNGVGITRPKSKQGFMTRSFRVGAGALSPHSLGSVGNIVGQYSLSPSASMESLEQQMAGQGEDFSSSSPTQSRYLFGSPQRNQSYDYLS
eukprot:TRINITY_DN3933_c2_g1_i2.p1 TRINITY_DN3933_c2_g1~~TRINITY_DN3933_c2_g1_i2.p1  ORF type:complete len:518 (+),score=34.21 TRINITY_DN3933_c2_g1_i2:139-1692(+)